ncbi:MAG: hypothetical protein K2Q03_02515 [Sphingobacteriaceae bacterium]|nr:hypothetical protein [Sphingobacteriaceae bacterium]
MKKIELSSLFLVFIVAIGISNNAFAQNYTKLKWHLISLGYAIPSGTGSNGGIYIGTEPTYLIKDNISIGFKIETALTSKKVFNSNGALTDAKIAAVGSYLLTGDYYLSTQSNKRFFAGAGLGLANAASVGGSASIANLNTTISIASASGFGGLLRVGADIRNVRFSMAYNIIPSSKQSTIIASTETANQKQTEPQKLTNSYLGFGISIFIGGGYKK